MPLACSSSRCFSVSTRAGLIAVVSSGTVSSLRQSDARGIQFGVRRRDLLLPPLVHDGWGVSIGLAAADDESVDRFNAGPPSSADEDGFERICPTLHPAVDA